ncbi:MAG: CHAT domain-containing protein [Bacteroidales bacterium]|nr:CHAT domain-containing protein [Bacteroidales bacterium]
MQNEGSKFLATENLLDVYLEAINIARILYHETSDISHLEASFRFAESSKSFALLSEIRKVEAMQFAGLPENIKEKDEQLTREIQAYEKILYEEENKENPDSMVILNTKDKIFHLRNSYNDLLQTIEHNYANYYNLKYDPHFVTIGEIQNNLKSNQTLVEYVLLDTALITFVIEKDFAKILSQEIDPQFPEECLEFYNVIHKQDFSNGAHKTYRNFVTLGQKFYKILVEPVLKTTDNKNLIVIPDGPITYLPFEAFLTEGADPEYIDYMDLEYLIYDLSIGYSHSSTLLYTERFKTKAPENKVLAFAPHYEDLLDVIDPASWNRQSNPDFLLPLPGVIQEVEKIELMVPSKAFYREEATEKNFKENCSDYNILHLAMHTRMNDNDPMMSNLVFSQTEDTLNDNRLYAYEIYNLQLNATMSVLSSCSSGYGNMMRGEGMMSLARGFIYAGCPSIIMTLWQVSDNSSAELMTSFYKFLRKGKNKQEALRLAKLNYLKGADDLKSNPYFWSGFVGIGDNSPVFRRLNMYYWGFLASGLVMIIAGIQFYSYWQKRKRRTSQD